MRALKIEPRITPTGSDFIVTVEEYTDHTDISKLIGCQYFCMAGRVTHGGKDHVIFCNDVGRITPGHLLSTVKWTHEVLSGNFLIVGDDVNDESQGTDMHHSIARLLFIDVIGVTVDQEIMDLLHDNGKAG